MEKIITSQQNPLVKNILLLSEKPRARREQNRMVIEGRREVRLAVAGGFTITDLLYVPDMVAPGELDPFRQEGTRLAEITPDIFNRLSYRHDSGGVIALAETRHMSLQDLRLPPDLLILVLETVEKPGNLGALLRTADAAGLDAVIVCDPQTDLFNPNTIRASLGCIFTLPVVVAGSAEAMGWMRANGIRMVATALTATSYYHNTDLTKPSAIIMGSEAHGLSEIWLEQADELVKIPMRGKVDSMNVSASAAVVIFEAVRQRGGPPVLPLPSRTSGSGEAGPRSPRREQEAGP